MLYTEEPKTWLTGSKFTERLASNSLTDRALVPILGRPSGPRAWARRSCARMGKPPLSSEAVLAASRASAASRAACCSGVSLLLKSDIVVPCPFACDAIRHSHHNNILY